MTLRASIASNPSRGVRPRRAVLAALLVALAAGAPSPSSAICRDCINTVNDTAFTPGIVAIGRTLRYPAVDPYVAFVGSDQVLRCAIPAPPEWAIEIVDPAAAAGGCSLAFDDIGTPMISYHDANGMLFWSHRLATGWTREPVDPTANVIGSTSLVRLPGGAGIAYVDAAGGMLRYARRNAGGSWDIQPVTFTGGTEAYPSLVADGELLAIGYYEKYQGDLRLALSQVPGIWSTALVDGQGDVGGYASLVGAPSLGGFGIAYYDFTNADLRYAYPGPGGWSIDTVDGAGVAVGRYCSAMALTGAPGDQIGIAYYDQTHGDLKYALKLGPMWVTGLRDSAGDTGRSASGGVVPAPDDTVGIAYFDQQSGDLIYRWHAGSPLAVPPPARATDGLRVEWRGAADGNGGRVRFAVPAAGGVRVALYDPEGRVIAVPLHQSLPAGPAEIRWDGRDRRGRRAGSGVFFVRVETAAGVGAATAVLLH